MLTTWSSQRTPCFSHRQTHRFSAALSAPTAWVVWPSPSPRGRGHVKVTLLWWRFGDPQRLLHSAERIVLSTRWDQVCFIYQFSNSSATFTLICLNSYLPTTIWLNKLCVICQMSLYRHFDFTNGFLTFQKLPLYVNSDFTNWHCSTVTLIRTNNCAVTSIWLTDTVF